jgi:uncharacterized protein with HEPN domain
MQPESKQRLLKYLQDALSAAQDVSMNTIGLGPQNYYYSNIKWIAERGIEIISEALKRSSVIYPDLPITDLQKIFATRNKIAHQYDIVDPLLLYNIVNKNIPVLIEELKSLIDKLEKTND